MISPRGMKEVAELNNWGVAHLQSGCSSSAARSFQQALALMKQIAAEQRPAQNNPGDEADRKATSGNVTICEPLGLQASEIDVWDGFFTSSYLYGRPWLFNDYAIEETMSLIPMLSSALLFNLALAYHAAGINGTDSALVRANMLYKMTLQLLDTCSPSLSKSLLSLVTWNNKAQIYHEHCEYKEIPRCLESIPSLISEVRGFESTLEDSEFEGLILNLMLLEQPTAARAA